MTTTDFYGVDIGAGPETASTTAAVLDVFEVLRPKSSLTPLIRIGGDIDGSYLVPDDLDGITACFSPGVNRIKYFEDYLTDHYGIRSHMVDFTCEASEFKTPLRDGLQTFAKKWLDVTPGADNVSLEDWVAEHEAEGDLLLQIDIEGAEYRNLLATPDETLGRFRIMVLELHGLGRVLDARTLQSAIGPFVEKLGAQFTCVHAHPNNCCGEVVVPGTDITIPNVLELTFVRRDRFAPGDGPVTLPHPLDVSRNVPRNAPLFLSEAWCGGPRPVEARVKMLEDKQRYRDEVGSATADDELSGVLALTMQSIQTVARSGVPAEVPQERRLVEVAEGRPYRLSEGYGSTSRTGEVRRREAYFFHTAFGANQSIRVDLGRRRRISRIEITNRTDGFQERARFLFVTLSGGPDTPPVFPLHEAGELPQGAWTECGLDLPDVRARYVTISSPVNTALHFADLRVYVARADEAIDTAGTTGAAGPVAVPPRPGRSVVRRVASAVRRRAGAARRRSSRGTTGDRHRR